MLEILVLCIVAISMAAKKGRRRKGRSMRNYLKGNVNETLALSTLAATTLISTTFDESVEERTLVSSIVAKYSLTNLTLGQGPIIFGVAHGDYTDAEIEEVIENIQSWTPGDKIAQERAKRQVREIGQFVSDGASLDMTFNDGKPVKTKLNWVLQSDATLRLWAYNVSGAALSTTAPIMHCDGHVNLFLL